MQPELAQTAAWGVCALATLKYRDVSNFGWTIKRKQRETVHLFFAAFYHQDKWNKRITDETPTIRLF